MLSILIGLLIFIAVACRFANKLKGLPPGPVPLPVVGNLLSFPDHFDLWVLELKKKYGPVFTLWLPYPTVVIAGYEELKRTIIKNGEAYSFRPHSYVWQLLTGKTGILMGKNEHYRSQRRFNLHTLKSFGMGKQSIQDSILLHADELNKQLLATNGEPVNLRPILSDAVSEVIYSMVFGGKKPPNDNTVELVITKGNHVFAYMMSPIARLLDIFPPIRYLDGLLPLGFNAARESYHCTTGVLKERVVEHSKTIDYTQEPTNYIDAFLHEIRRTEKTGEADEFTMPQLFQSVSDLYGAGFDTIVSTIRVAIITLLNQPQIQERLIKELDEVVGADRQVNLSDQAKMPYTNAFFEEIYRIGAVLSMNFVRITAEDTDCEGYFLPAGTHVIPQYQCEHVDDEVYPNPMLVVPERHLKDGAFVHDERVAPFSMGRRSCVGEGLARVELFLFFTSMLQKVTFAPAGTVPPELKWKVGAFRTPEPFLARVVPRS